MLTSSRFTIFSFCSLKSKNIGLGQTNWADKFWGICNIFGQTISSHFGSMSSLSMFCIIQPWFTQKKPLYVHPKYIWDWDLNLGRKELGGSVIHVYIGERFREFYRKHCDGSDFFFNLSICPKSYIPSTLNIDLLLWHTQLIVCAENVKSWFRSQTRDAHRGNSLHCMAENSLPLPNI